MTPETERRIRSVAANVADLRARIALLEAKLREDLPLEQSRAINGDLHVAMRARFEADQELQLLCWSDQEADKPKTEGP